MKEIVAGTARLVFSLAIASFACSSCGAPVLYEAPPGSHDVEGVDSEIVKENQPERSLYEDEGIWGEPWVYIDPTREAGVAVGGTVALAYAGLPAGAKGNLTSIFNKVAPATVLVHTQSGMGSGVMIRREGYPGRVWVLTAYHVVKGARSERLTAEVSVRLGELSRDGVMKLADRDELKAVVFSFDASRDVALLEVVAPPSGLPVVEFARQGPKAGDEAIKVGHPNNGLLWSVDGCDIAAIGSSADAWVLSFMSKMSKKESRDPSGIRFVPPAAKMIQSTCGLAMGDSGGPLVDQEGKLIGINVLTKMDAGSPQLASFHVHLDDIKALLRRTPQSPMASVPDPWSSGGGLLQPLDVDSDGSPDTLRFKVGGTVTGQGGPSSLFIDADEDTFSNQKGELTPQVLASVISDRAFDAEFVLLVHATGAYAWYDTSGDGLLNRLLVDEDFDGRSEHAYEMDAGGCASPNPEHAGDQLVAASHVDDDKSGNALAAFFSRFFPGGLTVIDPSPPKDSADDPYHGFRYTRFPQSFPLREGGPGRVYAAESPLVGELLFDLDGDSPRGKPAALLVANRSLDAEVAVITKPGSVDVWYDKNDDGEFDLRLSTANPQSAVTEGATAFYRDGRREDSLEDVGRPVIRPDLLMETEDAAALRGASPSFLSPDWLSAGDDGWLTLPALATTGASVSRKGVKGWGRGVIFAQGAGYTTTYFDLDLDGLGKSDSLAEIESLVLSGDTGAEFVVHERRGFIWVIFDTDDDGALDLALFSTSPGHPVESALKLDEEGDLELSEDRIGGDLFNWGEFHSKAIAKKARSVALKTLRL